MIFNLPQTSTSTPPVGKGKRQRQSETKSKYYEYLRSDHWANLRSEKLGSVSSCEICGSKNFLHVHHMIYRKDKYKTNLNELAVVCSGCHKKVHEVVPCLQISQNCKREDNLVFRAKRKFLEARLFILNGTPTSYMIRKAKRLKKRKMRNARRKKRRQLIERSRKKFIDV